MHELLDSGPRIIREQLNADSGWYYTVHKTLRSGRTEFQNMEIVETPLFGTTLLLDGATQVMEKNEFQYHEPMAHLALLAHPNPERVLIIGGGDGGMAREVLKHSCVKRLDFVELDEGVVKFAREYLPELGGSAFEDPRVHLVFGDGRAFVEAASEKTWDVVIMDMTDPMGPALMLYTQEFFRAISRVLRNRYSFFVMHSESPETRPVAFARIRRTLESVFPVVRNAYTFIRMYGTLWSIAISSPGADAADLSPEDFRKRAAERGIGPLDLVAPETLAVLYARFPYIEKLLETGSADISTDASPDFPDAFDAQG